MAKDTKFCKVTFFADLTNDDKGFMLNDFAETMSVSANIDSVVGVTVTTPDDDRTEVLLNNLIDYVSIGKSISETAKILSDCGFTKSELESYGFVSMPGGDNIG